MKPLANWSRPGTWPKYSTGLARGKTLSASKSKADCIPRSGDYAALELLRLPVPAVWSVQQIGGRWRIVFDRVSEESFVERVIINVIASPSLPTPTGITFVTTTTSLLDNSSAGTTIATFSVSMSDGSPFAGTLGASPAGTVAISGSTRLVLARALTSADNGSQQWTVIATQNGVTVSSSIAVQVIPLSPPPPPPPAPPPPPPAPAPGMLSPDGSVIYGGTDPTQPPPTSSLMTQYGVWTFGDIWAGPGPDGNCYRIPMLNGRQILNQGGVENQMVVFRQMQVNDGGNLWGLTFSSIWLVFDRYRWLNPSNNPGEGIPLDSLPTYTPPYTASADATIITGGTGSVTTIDGVWQFGSVNGNGWNLQLNGIPVTAGFIGTGGIGGVTPVSLIEVNAHGQLFAQGADGVADGSFVQWVAQEIQLGPATVPSGPVPVDMRFTPPCPNLSRSSPVGTYLTTVEVQMSDGSTFAGSYTIGASISGVIAGTSGNKLVTIVSPISGSSGQAEYFPVTATQNGCSVTNIVNFLTVT